MACYLPYVKIFLRLRNIASGPEIVNYGLQFLDLSDPLLLEMVGGFAPPPFLSSCAVGGGRLDPPTSANAHPEDLLRNRRFSVLSPASGIHEGGCVRSTQGQKPKCPPGRVASQSLLRYPVEEDDDEDDDGEEKEDPDPPKAARSTEMCVLAFVVCIGRRRTSASPKS